MRKERREERGKRETGQLECAYWRKAGPEEGGCVKERRTGHEKRECMRNGEAWCRESECTGDNERRYSDYLNAHPRVEAAPCLIANGLFTYRSG